MGLILGYGILSHGVIFLNDGLYWDGWVIEAWQKNEDKHSMRRFYAEVGMPNLYHEHWLIGRISRRLLAYRVISFASILLIAVFIFLTAVHTRSFNPQQATAIALLALSYPAFAVTFDGVVSLQYTLKIALFYAGCFFAVTTINGYDGVGFAVFAMALVLFYLAFNANSVLVYFWGFVLFYAWLALTGSPREFIAYEYAKISLLAILPFSYWLIKQGVAPRHGYYAAYNRIRLTLLGAFKIGLEALRFGIDFPISKPIFEAVQSKNASFILASIALGSLLFEYGRSVLALPKFDAFLVLGAGYALAFLAAAPFMLVGQHFSEGGWGSKNLMLFHLPFALVVFGWLQMIPNSYGMVLIPMILVANVLYIVKVHLLYVAISVKDKALIRWLTANSSLRLASVIKINEVHWIEYPFETRADIFRPAYLSSMVKGIWPDSRILATLDTWGGSSGRPLLPNEIEQALEETTIRYSFAPQVQPGPQYVVSIAAPDSRFGTTKVDEQLDEGGKEVKPSNARAMMKLALKYLYLRQVSSVRLGKLYDQYFVFSASELNFSSFDAPNATGVLSGNPAELAADE